MTLPLYPDLDGASVFITGGGSGIGAGLTEAFLRQGARVAFVQRSDAGAFCDQMEQATGNRPLFIACDITDPAALHGAIAQAHAAHGPIGVLVNNAANDQRHTLSEVTADFMDWALAINFKCYVHACQAVIPMMQAMGGGSVINITSISYMMGNAGYPIYTAANSALNGLTRSLAREFGRDRVRVNALAPGLGDDPETTGTLGHARRAGRPPQAPVPARYALTARYRRGCSVSGLTSQPRHDRAGAGY
jgi:galactose dehydrogenase